MSKAQHSSLFQCMSYQQQSPSFKTIMNAKTIYNFSLILWYYKPFKFHSKKYNKPFMETKSRKTPNSISYYIFQFINSSKPYTSDTCTPCTYHMFSIHPAKGYGLRGNTQLNALKNNLEVARKNKSRISIQNVRARLDTWSIS